MMHFPLSQRPQNQGMDRRATRRYTPSEGLKCAINPFSGETNSPATLVDVSQGGIGLLSRQAVEAGTSLIVTLSKTVSHFACRELVCVRHVKRGRQGTYHVGCEFVKQLTLGDLQALAPASRGLEKLAGPHHGVEQGPAQPIPQVGIR